MGTAVSTQDSVVLAKKRRTKSTFKPQGSFDFLKLPPDIRNLIYDLVYVKPTNIGGPGSAVSKAFLKEANEWRHLAFATSCRQIYDESIDIFYAKNCFEFFHGVPAQVFLGSIGARRRAVLTKVIFHLDEYSTCFHAFRYLKSCTGLQKLQVFVRVRENYRSDVVWNYPLEDALQFFLGFPHTLRIGLPQIAGGEGKGIMDSKLDSKSVPFALHDFVDEVLLVKREECGQYRTRKLPDVFTDQFILKKRFSKPSRATRSRFSANFMEVDMTAIEESEGW